MNKANLLYYATAFAGGGVVLAFELLNYKIIAPYFGASMFVWASIIGASMIGLLIGYFVSSVIIDKYRDDLARLIGFITLVAGLYTILQPWIGQAIYSMVSGMSVQAGAFLGTTILIVPFFALLGLISPLVIQLVGNSDEGSAGKTAGNVYALSTLGGVIFLLVTGTLLLPVLNVIQVTSILGGMLILLFLLSLVFGILKLTRKA